MKTKELSDKLGVKPATLQSWVRAFNIPVQQTKKGFEFSENDIDKIIEIQKLREQDNGIETIQKVLGDNQQLISDSLADNENNQQLISNEKDTNQALISRLDLIENNLSDKLNDNILKIAGMADRMNNMAYELGTVKADNKHLTSKLADNQQLISEQKDTNQQLISEISELKKSLEEKEKLIQNLTKKNDNLVIENTELKEKANQGIFKKLFVSNK